MIEERGSNCLAIIDNYEVVIFDAKQGKLSTLPMDPLEVLEIRRMHSWMQIQCTK